MSADDLWMGYRLPCIEGWFLVVECVQVACGWVTDDHVLGNGL